MGNDTPLSPEDVEAALKTLPGWEVRDGWLRRTYQTPGFSHTMLLANAIGYLAEAAYHHPDLSIGYAQVTVKLQTHKTRAITPMDLELAQKIEEVVLWQPGENSALDGYPKKWIH